MRIAIVTDIHANLQAWQAVLTDIRSVGVDALLCLGDVIGYGPQPAAVLDSVRAEADAVILGNHEAAVCGRFATEEFNDTARRAIEWTDARLSDADRLWFKSLPYTAKVEGFAISHSGLYEPEEFYYIEEPADAESSFAAGDFALTFYGHTHIPVNFRLDPRDGHIERLPPRDFITSPGSRYLINAGSVGEIRTGETTACYCLLDQENASVHFRRVPFDIAAYRADLDASSLSRRPMFLRVFEGQTVSEAEKQPFALKRRRRANVAAMQRTIQGLRAAREADAARQAQEQDRANAERRAASMEILKQAQRRALGRTSQEHKTAESPQDAKPTIREQWLADRQRRAEEARQQALAADEARKRASQEILRRLREKKRPQPETHRPPSTPPAAQ